MKDKKILYEVSIIRPLIIFLLVTLHSFTRMSSDWEVQLGGVEIYKYFCWFIQGFRIETIALIAGYVFAYQSIDLNKKYQFKLFVIKKLKRLILPMILFGLVYYFCFIYEPDKFNLLSFLVKLLSGYGHLWFLPMLFWCFIAIWIIDYFKLQSIYTLFTLAIISIIPFPQLPFGLTRLPHFIFYVYLGYFLWIKRDYIFSNFLTIRWVIISWSLYVVMVIVFHSIMPEVNETHFFLEKIIVLGIRNLLKLFMSCLGIIALYITTCNLTYKVDYRPKQWIINASNYCYGIYIYHQFILIYLYYHTSLVAICNKLVLPWIGLIVSIIISYILTKLTLKTKFGHNLIG